MYVECFIHPDPLLMVAFVVAMTMLAVSAAAIFRLRERLSRYQDMLSAARYDLRIARRANQWADNLDEPEANNVVRLIDGTPFDGPTAA